MAEVITVMNQKGGTGKTTTAMNPGGALASLGKKVMPVDMAPHASLSCSFGINDLEHSISDMLIGEKTLKEILVEKEGLYIALASTEMADTELYLTDKPGRENRQLQQLEGIEGIDFDEKWQLIGIDVLDVSQRCSLADIVNVNIEDLPLEAVKS